MNAEWDGWRPNQVMSSLNIFVGSLDAAKIEWLLCRTEVESIEVDSIVRASESKSAGADELSDSEKVSGTDDLSDPENQDDTTMDLGGGFSGMTINTGLELKGTIPSHASPINPATWQKDFDRSTARPKTSRKVSCPTPVQRDDYVRTPIKKARMKRGWNALYEQNSEDSDQDDDEANVSIHSGTPQSTINDRSADLSRVESCVSALNNPTSSADFILSVFKRIEVLLAILMGTHQHQFAQEYASNIKSALVAGHITTAVDCYRTGLRQQVSSP